MDRRSSSSSSSSSSNNKSSSRLIFYLALVTVYIGRGLDAFIIRSAPSSPPLSPRYLQDPRIRSSLPLHSIKEESNNNEALVKDLMSTLETDGRFNQWARLIKEAGLGETLKSTDALTLLVLSNEALEDPACKVIINAAKKDPQRFLNRILTYHIIPDRNGLTEFVNAGDRRSRIKTMERSGLSIAVYGGSVLIDETRVTEWGISASNGVIHILDGLLQPVIAGFEPYAQLTEEGDGDIAGVTQPLGLYRDKTEQKQEKLRLAELKHGRLAMVATMGVLVQEQFVSPSTPILASTASTLSLPFLGGLPYPLLITLALLPAALYEAYHTSQEQSASLLKKTEEGLTRILKQESPAYAEERQARKERITLESKELNNGRLAMIAWIGMLAQEVVTRKPLLSTFFPSS